MPGPRSLGAMTESDDLTPIQIARELLADGARYLVELFRKIANGIKSLSPLVLGLGVACSSDTEPVRKPPAAIASVVAPLPAPESKLDTGPKELGLFNITFYYVIGEDEIVPKASLVAANDNRIGAAGSAVDQPDDAHDPELTAIAPPPPEMVTLYSGDQCGPIADVSREFAMQLQLQGTGKLRDGRVLNIWGHCKCPRTPCFKVTENQWGTGGSGRPLQPFRTVAVDPKVIKLGSLLYVPLLEGRTMPGRSPWGGYVHDGCVVADDTGGGIDGNRLDLLVGRKAYFLGISGSGGSHAWARHVPVFDGSKICERKGRVVGRAGSI